MHPEIVRSKPGACPICGMALEPAACDDGRRSLRAEQYDEAVLGERGAYGSAAGSDVFRFSGEAVA